MKIPKIVIVLGVEVFFIPEVLYIEDEPKRLLLVTLIGFRF